jgi:branched-chain amino acid transport system substrate-binding protein
MPTMIQAGLYSATMHYLKAIEATGTDQAPKVTAQRPEESKGEWDLYKLLATVPDDEAFRPLDKGGCRW